MLVRLLAIIFGLTAWACVGGVKGDVGVRGGVAGGVDAGGVGDDGDSAGGQGVGGGAATAAAGEGGSGGDAGGVAGAGEGASGEGGEAGEGEGEGEGEGGEVQGGGAGGEEGSVDGGDFDQPDVPAGETGEDFSGRCDALEDCKSGICAQMGNFRMCSKFCDAQADCALSSPSGEWTCTVTRMVDDRQARICIFTKFEE